MFLRGLLIGCAVFSVLITGAIVLILLKETFSFFQVIPVSEFFFSTEWDALQPHSPRFGIWPLICGTLLITVIAMAVALASRR